MSEAAWNKAFTQGSRALQDRLKKVHANNPKFQSWMQKSGHATDTSVKQASKEVKPSARVKSLQTKSLQAYGATKGTKVGGDHGSEEMRDTIAPLTRDQHSKVQAAERAAKAAAKKAAPAKPKKPLSQAERMAAIARAVTKAKSKDRFDVPTVNPDDVDHDDLRDVHQSLHVRRGYNEEVEQIDELDQKTLKSYIKKNVDSKAYEKSPNRDAGLERATAKVARNLATSTLKNKVSNLKYTSMAKHKNPFEYQASRDELANRKVSEEVELDEVTKQEAEKMLGGPVKTRTGSEPKGKLPLGFRRARNLARKAMKTVKESTTEVLEVNEMNHGKKLAKMIMAKQSQHSIAQNMGEENIVEQDDSMEKKEMAQTQLHFIKYAAEEILEFIDMGGEVEEWYQNKLSKVQSEVESLHSYIEGEKRRTGMVEEVEQVDEKAPPGAKFERMVKHIKKGYAKGGLTPKEKSIAYATAWKAYNKANEEVEQLSEGPSHYQYSGTIHSNVGNAKHGEEKDDGHSYSITIPTRGVHQGDLGSFLSSKKAFSKISRENPHLEPHHVLAVMHGTGDDVEDVEVDHKGKTYKHRLYNKQEPDYLYEEVEQIEERYMGFKAVMAAAKKGGARDPAAVAASIGRKKYGKEKFQAMAAAGKKANEEVDTGEADARKTAPSSKEKQKEVFAKHKERMKELAKEEVVTEAEGKVAVTPKEKDLAAHHGDKTRITYGDVIKARLKSAAAKKMGNK